MTTRPLLLCTILAALCWGAGAARAGNVVDAAGRLPADVDALIVMEDARAFYRSPVGSAIVELAVRGAGFRGTRASWAALAAQLGMTSDQAVDALLGRRTVFAARWTEDGAIAWALQADLSAEMERRIQRALKPSPRQIVAGRPVLGVEGGTMEMVLAPRRDGARMVLGPAGEPALFQALAAALDRAPAAALAETTLLREIARVGPNADGLVIYRAPRERELWFAAVLDQSERELEVAFLVGVPGMQERGRNIAPWSRQKFDRIAAGAYLAVLDLNQLTWGDQAGDKGGRAGGIQLLSGLGLPLDLPPDLVALLADRFALVIRDSPTGPIDVALALETVDAMAMSRAGDRWLCKSLQAMSIDGSLDQRLEGLAQMPPTAMRTVDVGLFIGGLGGWTEGPHVAWGARIDHAHCNMDQHHGWWAVGLGPTTVQELGQSVADEDDVGIGFPWLSLGVARPSALVQRLEKSGVMVPPVMGPLRRVEEIRWAAMESGRGVVQGYGRVVVGAEEGGH